MPLWLIMLIRLSNGDGDVSDVCLCFAAPLLKTLDEYSSRAAVL